MNPETYLMTVQDMALIEYWIKRMQQTVGAPEHGISTQEFYLSYPAEVLTDLYMLLRAGKAETPVRYIEMLEAIAKADDFVSLYRNRDLEEQLEVSHLYNQLLRRDPKWFPIIFEKCKGKPDAVERFIFYANHAIAKHDQRHQVG